jgi:hypothetical protein
MIERSRRHLRRNVGAYEDKSLVLPNGIVVRKQSVQEHNSILTRDIPLVNQPVNIRKTTRHIPASLPSQPSCFTKIIAGSNK